MTDRKRGREPSSAEGEITEADPIVEDEQTSGRGTDRAIYGSEGGGGDNAPSHPRERKRRS